MTDLLLRAVGVMVAVAAALAVGLWVGGQEIGGTPPVRAPAVGTDDRSADDAALATRFFDGHRTFIVTADAIRAAAGREDWGAVRANADALSADAAATALVCRGLAPSAALEPFRDAYLDELAVIAATGAQLAAASAAADPVPAVAAGLAALDAAADGYDRAYAVFQLVS